MDWNAVQGLDSRYLPPDLLGKVLAGLGGWNRRKVIGHSVLERPIEAFFFGRGERRVLMWSQMHGNESTTTRALLDWIRAVQLDIPEVRRVLDHATVAVVPMLNPDGSLFYTRENANSVDLNRDAINRSQPETRALMSVFEDFKPDYCFNLHDQRTIFGLGRPPKPALVSFLAPAVDEQKSVPESRLDAMRLAQAMAILVDKSWPGQAGRFDDGFNPNCFGDFFQQQGVATVLVEAGFASADYTRTNTREWVYRALCAGLSYCTQEVRKGAAEFYLALPENQKVYCDLLLEGAHLLNPRIPQGERIGIQYKEAVQREGKWTLKPERAAQDPRPIAGHIILNLRNPKDKSRILGNPEILSLLELWTPEGL